MRVGVLLGAALAVASALLPLAPGQSSSPGVKHVVIAPKTLLARFNCKR
jgi:hypothetical protein